MDVLVVGGSGRVGGYVLPLLSVHHRVRVFDRQPPADARLTYIPGDVTDRDALAAAAAGCDALVWLAMGVPTDDPHASFDVNVKGLHLALDAACAAGVRHAVVASSMSVYDDINRWDRGAYFPDEDRAPDSAHVYGMTKRLGEEVCRSVVRRQRMSINALRLCLPIPDADYPDVVAADRPDIRTAASDVARAFLAALDVRGGFQAFMISGDYEEKIMSLRKARLMLGWRPLARPRG